MIFTRCGCLDPLTGLRRGNRCARLEERAHGSWYFHCSVSNLWGRRERVRRGGFASKAAARRARDALLAQSYPRTMGQTWTVARWLRSWLASRRSIRPGTLRFYAQHVDRYLMPRVAP